MRRVRDQAAGANLFEDGSRTMDHYPRNGSPNHRARRRLAGRGAGLPTTSQGLWTIGLCIVALECSQLLYHVVAGPDLTGDFVRALVAKASLTPPSCDPEAAT